MWPDPISPNEETLVQFAVGGNAEKITNPRGQNTLRLARLVL
jgi:hypothetical protein